MRITRHIFLALICSSASPAMAATEELAISHDFIPGAYTGRNIGQLGEIPMSTRLELGDWTLRTHTSLHLVPLDPFVLNDPNKAGPTFAGQARVVADDTRISVERSLGLGRSSWLTLKGRLRLPTAGAGLYVNPTPLEGAVALGFEHHSKGWMLWATGTQSFRGEGTGYYPRQDSLNLDLGAARWLNRHSMAGLSVSRWQSSYKGGQPGNSLGIFFSDKFKGKRKGELRVYATRQFSLNYSATKAALMLRLELD